jgi:predicted nucleic acid-binding protein
MEVVVDASVAAKWFAPEPGSRAAAEVLEGAQRIVAPDLIVTELANVFVRKIALGAFTLAQARGAFYGLDDLIDDIVPTRPLALPALRIAAELGHPAYDCFYLALAQARDIEFVTADRQLARAVARISLRARVRVIGA